MPHMICRLALVLLTAILPGHAGATLPGPRLDFSAEELRMAQAVAHDPELAAFYGARALAPVFTGPDSAARRDALGTALATAAAHGLPPARYAPDRLDALADAPAGDIAAEVALARTFALWVRDLSAGLLDPRKVDDGIKRRAEGVDVAALLATFAAAQDPDAVLARVAPDDPRYQMLLAALAADNRLLAPPGTPIVPDGAWREGDAGPAVAALRTRLAAVGFDTVPEGAADRLDAGLVKAVAAFQEASGLPFDGIAGPMTLRRLNADHSSHSRDILIALERFRWLPDDLGARHVWVNLPEYRARVIEDGQTVFDTGVVIGRNDPDMRTPEFSDVMEYVVVNPRWNVPRSITVGEYLPRLQRNRHAAAHMDVIDSRGRVVDRGSIDFSRYTAATFPYRMRQKPSEDNALGIVKFIFPNPWNIYLHDTPSKHLFSQTRRAYSHGCIRVGDPVDLARELLRPQSSDPAATFAKALKGGSERYLHLDTPLPVHLVYFTTWPGEDGRLRHFPDVYDRDAAVWEAWQKAVAAPSPLDAATGLETIAASR